MRVTIIFQGDFPEGGASTSRIIDLSKGLIENGCQVELLIMWASHFNDQGLNTKISGTHHQIPFTYINGNTKRPKSFSGKLIDTIQSFFQTFKYIRNNRKSLDILFLYCPDIHYNWPVYFAAKLFRIPVIIEQTELKSAQYLQNRKTIFYYLNQFDENYSYLFANYMTVNSKRLQDYYIQKYGNEKVTLIPNTVNHQRFNGLKFNKTYTIGYIGSFGVKDGLLNLIDGFAKAHKINSQIKLKLMGFCENPKNILERIKQYHLQDSIELTGPILYEAIPKELFSCDLLIMNRINSKYAQYGFPNKLPEYLATGIPVISTDVSDVSYYFKHLEHLYMIPPDDVQAIAEAINLRYSQEEEFNQMGERGRLKSIELFDYKLVSSKLLDVFKKASRVH